MQRSASEVVAELRFVHVAVGVVEMLALLGRSFDFGSSGDRCSDNRLIAIVVRIVEVQCDSSLDVGLGRQCTSLIVGLAQHLLERCPGSPSSDKASAASSSTLDDTAAASSLSSELTRLRGISRRPGTARQQPSRRRAPVELKRGAGISKGAAMARRGSTLAALLQSRHVCTTESCADN